MWGVFGSCVIVINHALFIVQDKVKTAGVKRREHSNMEMDMEQDFILCFGVSTFIPLATFF
jgi:hypothetical protein